MRPYADSRHESIAALGERGILMEIRKWLGPVNPPPPHGIGDDCSVLPQETRINLTAVDCVYMGKHFDESTAPELVGAKLLKRNLSDIASMGGWPVCALLSLTLPGSLRMEWLRGFFSGLRAEAERWDTRVVGGDLCSCGDTLGGALTALGRAERPALRTGAQPGDWIFTTGELGGSILEKHLAFEPRLREGRWLASRPELRSMIDLTDGISKDLPELLPEGCAALLEPDRIPISSDAHALAAKSGHPPLEHALGDGEDYELLFAINGACDQDAFIRSWTEAFSTPLSCIGRIDTDADPENNRAVLSALTGKPLVNAKGYEHF